MVLAIGIEVKLLSTAELRLTLFGALEPDELDTLDELDSRPLLDLGGDGGSLGRPSCVMRSFERR